MTIEVPIADAVKDVKVRLVLRGLTAFRIRAWLLGVILGLAEWVSPVEFDVEVLS